MNHGKFECDDGNNDPDDGCTPECEVMTWLGYTCTGGTPSDADTCAITAPK
jgi:hypothetical protein